MDTLRDKVQLNKYIKKNKYSWYRKNNEIFMETKKFNNRSYRFCRVMIIFLLNKKKSKIMGYLKK